MEIKKLDPAVKRYIKRQARAQKMADQTRHHAWFAWFPVRVDDETLVWLETVERLGILEYNPEWEGYSKKIGSWKYFKIKSE